MRRVLPAAVIALAAYSVSGLVQAAPAPGDAWTMYQGRPDHEAVYPGPTRGVSWRFATQGKIVSGLSLVGGTLYAASFDHRVYALDAVTGRLRWAYTASNVIMSDPIVARNLVVVGTGTNDVLVATPTRTVWGNPHGDEVVAVDASTGRAAWVHRTVGEDMPTPALVGNLLVFGNGHNVVQALDLVTGRTVWRTPVQGVDTMSSAAAQGTTVYLVSGMSPISVVRPPVFTYALDARTGKILWRAPYGNADCSPTLGQGLVFVEGSTTLKGVPPPNAVNTVDALDARTGKLVWSYTSRHGALIRMGEEAVAGTYVDGVLYQSLPETHQMMAFVARTGRVLWKTQTEASIKMSPVLWHGLLLAGDVHGNLDVMDARTGAVLATRKFPQEFTSSPPLVAGGTLYLANGRTVYAVPLSSLVPPSNAARSRAAHG